MAGFSGFTNIVMYIYFRRVSQQLLFGRFYANIFSANSVIYMAARFTITRATVRVIVVSFFAHDLFSYAATLNFDKSLQVLEACDYMRLSHWPFSSYISVLSHPTSCNPVLDSDWSGKWQGVSLCIDSGYVHTVTFLHGFVLFHNPKGIPIYFQTIENDAKTLPCAHSLRPLLHYIGLLFVPD